MGIGATTGVTGMNEITLSELNDACESGIIDAETYAIMAHFLLKGLTENA